MLHKLGIDCPCHPAEIEEIPRPGEEPAAYARRMAEEKAAAVARAFPARWVLGADTVVTLRGEILGKPKDAAHALEMLRRLRGSHHQVITALCLTNVEARYTEVLLDTSTVQCTAVSDALLQAYVNTGEALDKAGAYGIQGQASCFMHTIQGASSTVIGLPLHLCIDLLLRLQIITPCK
jgi:septum formation protein